MLAEPECPPSVKELYLSCMSCYTVFLELLICRSVCSCAIWKLTTISKWNIYICCHTVSPYVQTIASSSVAFSITHWYVSFLKQPFWCLIGNRPRNHAFSLLPMFTGPPCCGNLSVLQQNSAPPTWSSLFLPSALVRHWTHKQRRVPKSGIHPLGLAG